MANSSPETKQELIDHIHGPRAALVDALRFFEGEATTYDLREYSDVSQGSIHYHLDHLSDWGVVEKTGRQKPIGSGGKSDIYRLTTKGDAISSEVTDSETTADEVVSHEERLDELEDQIKSLKDMYSEMSAVLDALRDDLGIEVNKK